jgi:hypothetical protein
MNKYLLYYKDENTLKKTEFKDVLDNLYNQKASLPTEEQIKQYMKVGNNNKIKEYLKGNPSEIIQDIKVSISKINNKIPLYDVYTKNLYLISKELVYRRVVRESYRFPDESLITILSDKKDKLKPKIKNIKKNGSNKAKKLSEFSDSKDIHYGELHESIREQREFRKLKLMLEFLNSFDNETVYDTYVRVFYAFANEVGKDLTVCSRRSFLPHYKHIKPWYTRSELINLALNMEEIKPSDKYYDEKEVMKLCKIVRKNDISADTIMKHQNYIVENNKIGIIQYYSLQGSFFINQYLRNLVSYDYKNELLEENIRSMWKLTSNAPEFDKSYTLYRFIQDDSYLQHLKIGCVFTDPSFISTTRDPFYRSELYKFGFILIKIKIPKNVKGVGLCIESYSNFPEEQEIILSPLSKLKLEKKDENALYYHTDQLYAANIKTRYEFSYVGKEKISFVDRPLLSQGSDKVIDFLKLPVPDVFTVYEKIKQFIDEYTNDIYQFKTKIGDTVYDLIVEWYDSTNAYKKFYAAKTNNGFSIYTLKNNHISFLIELGEEDDETYMYINYYFRYSLSNRSQYIDDIDFLEFISKIAYYFRIEKIILYAEYASCDTSEELKNNKHFRMGGNFCIDFYKYLKNKEKRFIKGDSTEFKPQFSFYELDRMRNLNPDKILQKDDRDELYQIYHKTYVPHMKEIHHNLADFYIWMIENQCVHLDLLIDKMYRIYNVNNPFNNDYYVINPMRYLYNKELIKEIPTLKKSKKHKGDTTIIDRMPKNDYRTQSYRNIRLPPKV